MRTYEHGLLWTELQATCPKCSCDFIYYPKDLKKHIEYNFTTQIGRAYRYVVCPECGSRYIYTDPTTGRFYNDYLEGTQTEPMPETIIYDGGNEDLVITIEENDEDL